MNKVQCILLDQNISIYIKTATHVYTWDCTLIIIHSCGDLEGFELGGQPLKTFFASAHGI